MIIYTPPSESIGSGSEDIVIVNGPTHSYNISAGDTLLLILLYNTTDTTVDVGTAPADDDIAADIPVVDGFAAEHLTTYFATNKTLYFSGLSASSIIKLKIISTPVILP